MAKLHKFNYPSDLTTPPEYNRKRGAMVEVVREATTEESDHRLGDMEVLYVIRDPSDGWTGFAWASEIFD